MSISKKLNKSKFSIYLILSLLILAFVGITPVTALSNPAISQSIASVGPVLTDRQPEPTTLNTPTTQTTDKKPKNTTDKYTSSTPEPAAKPKINPLDFSFLGVHLWVWLLIIAIGDFLYAILSSRRKK
ncbi:hypothetical protein COV88_03555 [Candidatus Saccharibacteria bacterium CG11_big_fil_rev_8_21_14_0_20_41_19]|nr:hypothetical protein [Candidatus Saccharibacteria bacterium]OIP86139.1 MAG: hypothetical protein AUK57_01580 [Candidatus Saccharibacteria bacterium CG2_30_41_52]PIQ70665.1 MAG: hypothetical protein COV88_03555 [Candidatus Saccharibacteria bacterium CG11_big_fil_rev_8_21_14_0_20_41_19]PIZ59583.1 MAG: hypothetical protein COY18_03080 [Candidatus Saccharibacteria bacterium CG_4_10_14_0_2_um_filter_41_11]PJE66221.1 MAG: hypothetical protein COU92_01820 [Candidatus Saccharibacteria bacterium CG10